MNERIIEVAGANLFVLAAEHLNDATQWIRIAQANKLSDPQIDGVCKLIIPPLNPGAGGGVAV